MRYLSLLLILVFLSFVARAQFTYTLTGNPIVTTGWNMGGAATVSGNSIILTNSTTSTSGYIYYANPVNLTGCSQFTVDFEFKIDNSSAPPADGIAFWYITTPPAGFIVGGGIGLPNNPNGLVLLLDTYDNDGNVNNPLGSLRYLNGTNYVEGSATGQIGPDVTSQGFMTNGLWHSCQLIYNNGNLSVSFDGAPPVITGFNNIGINGYFGFSAATGASWSTHAIRNVSITGNTLVSPVANSPVTYCQFDAATALTAVGTDLKWYTTPIGGTPLPSAPVPNTSVPGTYNWYVSQTIPGCGESNRDTVEVIVNPKPTSPVLSYKNSYCAGEPFVPFTGGTNLVWYTTQTGGLGFNFAPVINTAVEDSFTYYVSQVVNGCESDRSTIKVKIITTPNTDFAYTVKYGCNGDTVIINNLTTGADFYQWDFGDGTGDTATHPTHIFPTQGTYTIKLKAINENGCADSSEQLADLVHLLDAAFAPDQDTICNNGLVTFSNLSVVAAVAHFYWDFGDETLDSSISPVHAYANPGVYTVRLIAQNFDLVDCQDTAFHTIVVDSIPVITFTTSDSVLCEGQGIRFIGDYTRNGNTGFSWSFGDGVTMNDADQAAHNYDSSGSFVVNFHADYRVCPDMDFAKAIEIKPFPLLNLGPDTSVCQNGAPIGLTDGINGANASAKWLWNTGETTPMITARHPGIYTLKVEIDGCETNDSIEIFKDCYLDIPNAFTPNADGANDYFLPRQLLSQGAIGFRMNIYNRWGQQIFETTKIDGRGWDGRFNEKDQPSGVYVYIIDVIFKNGAKEHYTGNVTLLR
ncbi:MAG: PKD domain-containing protein [Sphingobacteriales bacterium]|nr:MAG: PKD domain-containing protein [Sphingobacteriales bacterium]